MSSPKKKIVYAIFTLLTITTLFGTHQVCAESALPKGLAIEETFRPGIGAFVGEVELVQGNVFVIHKNTLTGYRVVNDLPLFEGDTLITQKRGRVRFGMNDGSILTLASETTLVLSRSVYDPAKKTRSSFLGMTLGKARFWVKKLFDFKRSEFKVKTKTAVVGVRGSDFIVIASADRTEVTALEQTDLEVVSLVGPAEAPSVIADFERIVIEQGSLPSSAEELFSQDIEVMKRAFILSPESAEPEGHHDVKLEVPSFKAPVGKEVFEPAMVEKGILVPEEELVDPESLKALPEDHRPEMLSVPPVFEKAETFGQTVLEKQEEITERRQEEIRVRKGLPPFPGEPE